MKISALPLFFGNIFAVSYQNWVLSKQKVQRIMRDEIHKQFTTMNIFL